VARLPVRRLRLRLASLRRLSVRRLWLLLEMGTLPRLLKGTLRSNPVDNKKPRPAWAAGASMLSVLVCRLNGQLTFRPNAQRESIGELMVRLSDHRSS